LSIERNHFTAENNQTLRSYRACFVYLPGWHHQLCEVYEV